MGRHNNAVLFLLMGAFLAVSYADVLDLYNTQTAGSGTWHQSSWPGNGGLSGSCSYSDPQPFTSPGGIYFRPVAIDVGAWNNAATCGMCAIVYGQGENGTASPAPGTTSADDALPPLGKVPMMVYVVDQCGGCNRGIGPGFDVFSPSGGNGVWKLKWKAVDCPVGDTMLGYQLQGSNPSYIKVQVRGARIPVKSIQIVVAGKTYDVTGNSGDGYYFANNISPTVAGSFTIKMTSINGETLTDTIPSVTNDRVFPGSVQFSAYKPYDGSGGDGDGDGDGGDGGSSSAVPLLNAFSHYLH
eukprot:TRINITY_DN1372_c0_g1_i2.p1 TRINITY_DN1372_c0_g1~~TRINITY_DN1372_c0_g1_i2.p1  ORF type:complete len:298 (-),score=41.18 TRINITY_DN1372_c0_g1_i2:102-995(-)